MPEIVTRKPAHRPFEAPVRRGAGRAGELRPDDELRQASACLERSRRRLKRGESGEPLPADEVLRLMAAALAHLDQAIGIL